MRLGLTTLAALVVIVVTSNEYGIAVRTELVLHDALEGSGIGHPCIDRRAVAVAVGILTRELKMMTGVDALVAPALGAVLVGRGIDGIGLDHPVIVKIKMRVRRALGIRNDIVLSCKIVFNRRRRIGEHGHRTQRGKREHGSEAHRCQTTGDRGRYGIIHEIHNLAVYAREEIVVVAARIMHR